MKQVIFLSLLILTIGCSKKQLSVTPSNDGIDQFLDQWHQAAADAKYEDYFGPIADTGIYVGTDASEVWTKEEFSSFAKPFFDDGRAWAFTAIKRNIYFLENDTYFFNETLDTWMGVCRGSGVIKKNELTGEFEIFQYVLSLTVPNDDIRDVMEVIEGTE